MKKLLLIIGATLLFTGCASVPMADNTLSNQAKQINDPATGNSGIYVYRSNSPVGGALKKDVWIDDECLGETSRGIFFHQEVKGDVEHVVATESEFSANKLILKTEMGKNYFVQQYIKIGAFVGGANLKLVDEATGKAEIQKLSLAQSGKCSKPNP